MWKQKLREPLWAGIITVAAGVALAFFPLELLSWVLRAIGLLLLAIEIFRVVDLFRLTARDTVFFTSLISEIAVGLLALILLITPLNALRTLAFTVGIYLAATSALAIYRAYRVGGRGAAFISSTALSIVTAIAGVWLIIYPSTLYNFIGIFLGIALIIKGALLIIEGTTADGAKRKSKGHDKRKNNDRDYYSDDFVDKSHEL